MSDTPDVPMVYLDDGSSGARDPAETALMDAAIQRFVRDFDGIPPHLKVAYLSSILLTGCMGNSNPSGVLGKITEDVGQAMRMLTSRPAGRG